MCHIILDIFPIINKNKGNFQFTNLVWIARGGFVMDFFDGKGAEQVINDFIEREMSEYKKATDKDLSDTAVTEEARAAFNRKPYYNVSGATLKKKPVVK